MRCFGGTSAKAVVSVSTGDTLGFVASSGIMHFGPAQFYMARVPEDKDVTTWDAAGNVWFKVGSIAAVAQAGKALTGTEESWPAYREDFPTGVQKAKQELTMSTGKTQVGFKVPNDLPSGNYLVRVESIALHLAQQPNGAQFYIACGQVKVTGGGSGTPGPLVAFPGAYKASDPGLIWRNSPPQTSYTAPGPPVWGL